MLSATAALRALALGDGTASQLLEAHVARIAQHNPRIRALVTLDIERARAAAQAVDALPLAERTRRLAGEQPLLGLPISIKDAFATQGLRTTSSHPPLANYLPAADATLVARLKAAGAIVLGKSNLSELAGDPQCWSPLFGPTHNPWDLSLTPGGSSGGSAAAIAMGFAALELGSDIGGSIRIPAACCGVVGFKASENRLPRTGHIPHLPGQPRSVRHMLSFGLLARTVADVAHAMPSLAGADGEDQEVPPLPWRPQPPLTRPLRLAWCDDFAGLPLCPRTRAGLTQALAGARAAGHQLLRRQPAGPPLAQVWRAFGVLAGSEIGLALPARQRWPLALLAGLLPASQPIAQGFAQGARLSLRRLQWALGVRDAWLRALESMLYEVDAWLCPTLLCTAWPASPPPRHGGLPAPLNIGGRRVPYLEATLSLTSLFSLSGSPVLSLQVGVLDGVPVGVQLVGRKWRDEALLAMGESLTAAWPAMPMPPGAQVDD